MLKGIIIGAIYGHVATMCLAALAYQVYYGGDNLVMAVIAAAISCYLCYLKYIEINAACEKGDVHNNGQG